MIRRLFRSGLRCGAAFVRCGVSRAVLAGTVLAFAAPTPALAAQRAGPIDDDTAEPVATTSVPVVQPIAPSPTRVLNTALARLARDPRDLSALLDAGSSALDLGDTDAAIGFLTRAEQVVPGHPGVRARMAIAMLRSNQPFEAIRWFDLAEQAGFNRVEMATERGLAYDLIGDNTAAQRQYQLALTAGANDEASRRYALSLVIAGDRHGAELVIQPLLERRDRGAWRVRTFIMAIAGQSDEAEGIARATMPADLAAAISPYLRYMPRLTPAQQAAAANLGRFPRAADIGRDDPQIVQYALAHPRAPRVDAGLVPQGEALGARGRDDRSKRRRPGKDAAQGTALAAASPAQSTAAVSAPWGLQPGPRPATGMSQPTTPPAPAPTQPQAQVPTQPQLQPTPQPTSRPAVVPPRPAVLSKLDVPPGTPLAPPPPPQPVSPPPPPRIVTPASGPAPAQVASAAPSAAAPALSPAQVPAQSSVQSQSPVPGQQLALASPQPAGAAAVPAAPDPTAAPPAPAPTQAVPTVPAATGPADFGSVFSGFKAPEQETAASVEAVDLARIEALRQAARAAAAAKAKDRAAKDRGARPDGPTAVSRTSDEDMGETVVTRAGKDLAKDKSARDLAAKDAGAKPAKDKLALAADCLDKTAKGGKGSKNAKSTKAKPAAKSARGKAAADAQCPPDTAKAKGKNGKAEPAHASRIWVQVLTGSNREAMGKEWQRLVREASTLRSRKPYITPWRSNYRLLTGPFASDAEAQAFLGALRKDGVSGFEWTSPAGQAVDGLSVK